MKNFIILFFVGALALFVASCTDSIGDRNEVRQPNLPEATLDYVSATENIQSLELPTQFNVVGSNQEIFSNSFNNPVFGQVDSDAAATLGRVLFYDSKMSKNNSIACASCHKQELAFADGNKVSEGFGGKLTHRNSMSLANPILNSTFFWDGRSRSLQDLSLRPVFNHVEMGMDNEAELIRKLADEPYYDELFIDAYGTSVISTEKIQDALSQFISSIVSDDSKFDEGMTTQFANFNELEKHGMALFFSENANCSSCHNGVNFASPTAASFDNPYMQTAGTTNIGLDIVYEDPGFADGQFKIPSLRNIALTAPYMHDGRFETLRDVLDHYNEEIQPHHKLDSKLHTNGAPKRLGLTELDLDALEAFLNTLSAKSVLIDERYSNPFK